MTEAVSFKEALDGRAAIIHNDIMDFLAHKYTSLNREADELEARAKQLYEQANKIRNFANAPTIVSPDVVNQFLKEEFGIHSPSYKVSEKAATTPVTKSDTLWGITLTADGCISGISSISN